ncbi:dihydroneopterin aldolase [Endozoicomonas sp. SCSIO W0465]|uniref:dihydroneopterin aldolase n=1 Tax=Endozoicomonas sp. SCSIO W0465 TaxID=2918516 RepID=UPI002075534D|nr:dihydroneopterin aldolase [Endozoicomonas sp. SCSIO W0465]USE37422.1 dihydroneopterin aldolase [Endozoicomonas sp. SCSIO W0465]
MDKVRIEAVETQAVIGVYEFEHAAPQPLVLDLELTTDFSRAFISDDLQDALDYDAITQRVRAFCEGSRYQLIEALAGGIITEVIAHYPVDRVAVTIRKPKALTNALATVWCERTRAQMMAQE